MFESFIVWLGCYVCLMTEDILESGGDIQRDVQTNASV